MKNLFFVTGLRKSGTSMVRALLDGHPEIFVFPANEFELFHYSHHLAFHAGKYTRERDLNRIKDELSHNSFIERLNKPKVENDLLTSIDVKAFQAKVASRAVERYPEIIEVFFEAMAASWKGFSGDLGKMNYAFKCVLNEEYLPEVLKWYPKAKMVYVLRNPYGHFNAIRNSMRKGVRREGQKLSWWRNPYPVLGGEVRRMRLSYNFMEKWKELYPDNFYVLVYDRLVNEPEKQLRGLADYLEIEFDESLLGPTVDGRVWRGNSWTVTDFAGGIDKRPATLWRNHISGFEVRLINQYFGDVLQNYGFEVLDGRTPLWFPNDLTERPLTFMLNRLVLKAPSWFGGIKR